MNLRSPGIVVLIAAFLVAPLMIPHTPAKATQDGHPAQRDSPSLYPDEPVPKCQLWDSMSLRQNVTKDLYAGDQERDFADDETRDQWINDNCGDINVGRLGTEWSPFKYDRSFRDPPGNQTSILNREQFMSSSFETGYYPNGDGHRPGPIRINRGQAKIFAIENGTKVHVGGGETRTVIPEQGTLYGFFHFNTTDRFLNIPPAGPEFPTRNYSEYLITGGSEDGFYGDTYTVDYESACLVVNGGGSCSSSNAVPVTITFEETTQDFRNRRCTSRSCNKSGRIALDYDLSEFEEVDNITFRVQINQTFEQTLYECTSAFRRNCYTDDGERRSAWWTERGTRVESKLTSLSDTIDVDSIEPSLELEIARFPDGDREVRIVNSTAIRELQFGNGDEQIGGPDGIRYQWRYFSASNSYWEFLEQQPVWIHAYPVRDYKAVPVADRPEILDEAVGTTRGFAPGNLPSNVNVDTADRYTAMEEIVVGDINTFDRSEIKLIGIAPGRTRGIEDVDVTTRRVEESVLNANVVGGNETHAEIEVVLKDADGDPINTRNRPGSVYIDGQKVETGPDGKVTVERHRWGPVRARYEPTEWYRLPSSTTPYIKSEAEAYPGVGRSPLAFLIYLLKRSAPLWGTALVALYLLDKLPDAETWPPWRVIQ